MRRLSSIALPVMLAFMFLGALTSSVKVMAQKSATYSISGKVWETTQSGDSVPIEFALVAIPDYGISSTTGIDGTYTLKNVPRGKAAIKVSYVGKVTIDRQIDVTAPLTVDFTLADENFKLKEVMVTAQLTQAGGATSSIIGRNAMDHIQATSLSDIMSLLPGAVSSNQSLNEASEVNVRSTSPLTNGMNAMGTAIIRDGAPISNNANLNVLGSSASLNAKDAGGNPIAAVSGTANPSRGVDLREISTDNIESVEVIRGIPSVEHGDLTSGAVLINSKAGREPLRITGKANPNVYMGSVSTGFNLGQKKGAMNLSADYAHNTNDPTQSYKTYQRVTARAMYSKELAKNLRSNTSLSFVFGKDKRKLNPDDKDYQRASHAEDYGVTLNTNGLWSIDKGILKSMRYVASGTYTSRQTYYQSLVTSNNTPYSGTFTDGAVLSNFAGQHIFDKDGNEITNFGEADANNFAYCLPSNYLQWYNIDSREINVFGKLVFTLFKQTGYINNRVLFGADFRSDGNVGHGKTFDPLAPPERPADVANATYRYRDYRDIPFLNQLGLFAEENFTWQLGLHELRLQAGVRYDHANRVGGQVSPRFNASYEILPNKLWIRGGYGVTAKMPTMMQLFPENAYFEYINLNELASTKIPEGERLYITTTKVHQVDVNDLKIATNRKAEVGLDLRLGRNTFTVTGFYEKLKNGYSYGHDLNTYAPFEWTTYKRDTDNQLISNGTYSVLSSWYAPGNNLHSNVRGVEFDFSFARFDKINTTLSINGSWMRAKSSSSAYEFYDPTMNSSAQYRKDIAIYDANTSVRHDERMVSAVRLTHNLPRIGFVVTLTGQTVWKQANWKNFSGDVLPVGYMSLQDGKPYWFADEGIEFEDINALKASSYGYMYRDANHNAAIRESYHPYFCFNMNVTKELGEMVRVSFFANNMFRNYPRRKSERNTGGELLMNSTSRRYYFGVELQVTL